MSESHAGHGGICGTTACRADEDITRVLFRAEIGGAHAGDVTAVFPDLPCPRNTLTCYAHIGQHSACSRAWIRESTRPATPQEYAPLKRELESLGYELRVIGRLPR